MSIPFTILRLQHRDPSVAEAIRAVMFAAYQVEAAVLEVDDFVPLRRTASHIASTDALFLGIILADTLVAVAEVETPEPGHAHIGSLVVLPSHFRRGLASALVSHVVAANDGRLVSVSTGACNEPAIRLYEAHGFRAESTWQTPDGIPMVTLERL